MAARSTSSPVRRASRSDIGIVRTPIKRPQANALCERYIGSVRRECLDHLLIVGKRPLSRVIKKYVDDFNRSRLHQGIGQYVPCGPPPVCAEPDVGKIIRFPILNGLHHDYRRAA
jgi:transposase InsO family protein